MGTSGGELLLHVKDVFNSSTQVHLAALACLLNKLYVTMIGSISCFYEGVPPLDLKLLKKKECRSLLVQA